MELGPNIQTSQTMEELQPRPTGGGNDNPSSRGLKARGEKVRYPPKSEHLGNLFNNNPLFWRLRRA